MIQRTPKFCRWAAAAVFVVQTGVLYAEEPKLTDPKLELEEKATAPLTAQDEKTCRELFKQIASDDQDAREQAAGMLVAKGPPVLKLAGEYAHDKDADVAEAARGLSMRIVRDFDGYFPTAPELEQALKKRVAAYPPASREDLLLLAKENGIALLIDPHAVADVPMSAVGTPPPAPLGELLSLGARTMGAAGIPRGNVYLITSPDAAERLSRHRQRFDWSGLQLNRDDATDVTQALQNFFPPQSTELHAGGEMLVVQGSDASVVRAARLVTLLSPNTGDAVWPAPQQPVSAEAVEENLSAPVSLSVSTDTPLNALELLKAKGHPVGLVRSAAPDGELIDPKKLRDYAIFKQDPTLAEFEEFSNLRVSVHELPLGLALRWIERRCRFLNENQTPRMFSYETGPDARLQFRIATKPRPLADLAVGGADVSFLYATDAKLTWTNDKDASEKLYKALESHLLLFPSFDPRRELCVIHGRMLIAAPWATAQRAVELVREWRESAKPPETAQWQEKLQQKLEASLEWTGRGVTGGTVIRRIADTYGVNILMEDSADGHAPDFQLHTKDAALLPPGPHTAKELLDALGEKVNADWSLQLGAVVLTPKPETTAEKKKNDGF